MSTHNPLAVVPHNIISTVKSNPGQNARGQNARGQNASGQNAW